MKESTKMHCQAGRKDFSRLYEPDINDGESYTEELLQNAKDYSDTAIVVIGRSTGESNDNPQKQYKINKRMEKLL